MLTRTRLLGAAVLMAAGLVAFGCSSEPGEESPSEETDNSLNTIPQHPTKPLCGAAPKGQARCFAQGCCRSRHAKSSWYEVPEVFEA